MNHIVFDLNRLVVFNRISLYYHVNNSTMYAICTGPSRNGQNNTLKCFQLAIVDVTNYYKQRNAHITTHKYCRSNICEYVSEVNIPA